MTQLQEAIRDKITKYSDACGMCTDITKDCDTCGITCVLEDLNELQKLANNSESLQSTAHWNIKEIDRRGVILSWECDKCGRLSRNDYPYCPHCGKRMVNANE